MAPPGRAEECNDVSVMVIQCYGRSPECQGSEPTLLGLSGVRLKPVPDQLRFSAGITLHGLVGSAQAFSPNGQVRKRPADIASDRLPNLP